MVYIPGTRGHFVPQLTVCEQDKMKLLILSLFIACALAAPQYNPYTPYNQPYAQRPYIPITSQTSEHNHDGSYRFAYTSGNGIAAEESGYLRNPGSQAEAETVQGSFSYTSPEGQPISLRYVADENGFRAEGAHLPTPPPIPEAIARSLAYIRSQPAYQEPAYNQGAYRPVSQPAYRPVAQPAYRPYRF